MYHPPRPRPPPPPPALAPAPAPLHYPVHQETVDTQNKSSKHRDRTSITATTGPNVNSVPVGNKGVVNTTMKLINTELVVCHKLRYVWDVYCHMCDNPDWSLQSYQTIAKGMDCMEESIEIADALPDALLCKTMIFVMQSGIGPFWEDKHNRQGGSFSFKIVMRDAPNVWRNTFLALVGGYLCKDTRLERNINGISLSPKKNFVILKIWTRDCVYQDVEIFADIHGLVKQRSLFRSHMDSS
jgi:Eukaryotic initiation factor 4E